MALRSVSLAFTLRCSSVAPVLSTSTSMAAAAASPLYFAARETNDGPVLVVVGVWPWSTCWRRSSPDPCRQRGAQAAPRRPPPRCHPPDELADEWRRGDGHAGRWQDRGSDAGLRDDGDRDGQATSQGAAGLGRHVVHGSESGLRQIDDHLTGVQRGSGSSAVSLLAGFLASVALSFQWKLRTRRASPQLLRPGQVTLLR